MIKIVSIFNALYWLSGTKNVRGEKRRNKRKTAERTHEKNSGQARDDTPEKRHWGTVNGDVPFAVRYIKLVVECFESYHSHFDELARRIDRREDFAFRHRYLHIPVESMNTCDTSGNTCGTNNNGRVYRKIIVTSTIVKSHKKYSISKNLHAKLRLMNGVAQEGTRSNRQIGCGVLLLWISYHSHFWRFGSPFYASPSPSCGSVERCNGLLCETLWRLYPRLRRLALLTKWL